MYDDIFVKDTFEKGGFCSTAEYKLNANGTVTLRNFEKQNSPTGPDYVVNGHADYATVPPPEPGQLMVHFDPGNGTIAVNAPYWVLKLGPVKNNKYEYSIVSDNVGAFLFVLARDVGVFNTTYRADVEQTLAELNFKGIKKPIPTYQGTDCVYH